MVIGGLFALEIERPHGATEVELRVEDDGKGINADSADTKTLGLLGMRERVALVDGRLTLESAAGAGTTLAVEVPLP